MPKLTKTFIDNLTPTGKEQWYPDSELKGFCVRLTAKGSKLYVARYWIITDNQRIQRKLRIARCSDMVPEKARDLARKIFAKVAEGIDPAEERKVLNDIPTIEDLKKRYMSDHAKPFKKPRSCEIDETNWRLHILPTLGKKKIRDVTRTDIITLAGSMSETPVVANQCIALLSKAFNLCEEWEWRAANTNPCKKVKKYTIQERETILSKAQIKTLYDTLTRLENERRITRPMSNLVRLLMLTGCRLREIMHARMEWVSKDRNLLELPDSKTGQKKVALSAAAMAIINTMNEKQEWLIPGVEPGKPIITPYHSWKIIKKEAKLPKSFRMHDLRHTAGSLAHMAGLSQKEIQILLGHKQIATTARYLHGHANTGHSVADKMADVITSVIEEAA